MNASEVSQTEIRSAILLLGLALPMQAVSATLPGRERSLPELPEHQRAADPAGSGEFSACPGVISLFTSRVDLLIASLVVSRAIALWFYRSSRPMPASRRPDVRLWAAGRQATVPVRGLVYHQRHPESLADPG